MSSVISQLAHLFNTHCILTIKQLQEHVGRSRRTLFRDMSQLVSLSSYTHAGKYHTLESIAQFNSDGLWFYEGVGFSQHGTLKLTLIHKICGSPAGYTHEELSRLLRIRVHDSLRVLVHSEKIQRRSLLEGVYVYLSHDDQILQQQFNQRMLLQEVNLDHLPSIDTRIEILAETVRYYLKNEVDAERLMPGLRLRGILVTCEEIETVLAVYEIKKNTLGNCSINKKID